MVKTCFSDSDLIKYNNRQKEIYNQELVHAGVVQAGVNSASPAHSQISKYLSEYYSKPPNGVREAERILKKRKAEEKKAAANLLLAQKKYINTKDGPGAYKEQQHQVYLGKFTATQHAELAKKITFTEEFDSLLDYYQSELTYGAKMKSLLDIKITENKNLRKALGEMRDTRLTNERRYEYEEEERDNLTENRYILYYFYYGTLLIYFIFGDYFSKERYKQSLAWVYLLSYLSIPFLINYFVRFLFQIYNQILYMYYNKAPRNVYTSL